LELQLWYGQDRLPDDRGGKSDRERMSVFNRKFRVETIRKLKQDVQELVKDADEFFDKVKEHEKEKKSRYNAQNFLIFLNSYNAFHSSRLELQLWYGRRSSRS
jgi:hypothetical protein